MKNKRNIWYYIRNYKFQSIFIKNLIFIMLMFILPFTGMGIVVYNNSNSIVQDEISTVSLNSLYRIRDMTDTLFRDLDLVATSISLNTDVNIFMISSQFNLVLDNAVSRIGGLVTRQAIIHKYIDSIYVYSERNNYVISNRENGTIQNFGDNLWHQSYLDRTDNTPWIEARIKENRYPYFISIMRPAYLRSNERLGTVVININAEEFGRVIGSTNFETENVFIIDEDGMVIYNSDMQLFRSNIQEIDLFDQVSLDTLNFTTPITIDDNEYILSIAGSNVHNWRYISFLPLEHFQQRLDRIRNFIFSFFVAGFLTAMVISFILSARTYQPVKSIVSLIENAEEWDYHEQKNDDIGRDELKYIASNIVKNLYSNQMLKSELEQRLALLNKAQTTALQAQINPHFLYNTLDTIKWMSMELTKGNNQVSDMVSNLSELMRISLDNDEQVIPIATELDHVRLYLQIMKARYGDDFVIDWEMDVALDRYKIVKLTLQPLVENAIYHGLKPARMKGWIRLSGEEMEDKIKIVVADNGVGMEKEEVIKLNAAMAEEYELLSEHIGLYNVNQRIKLIFGTQYGLVVHSSPGQGTSIIIELPKVF